MTTAWRLLRHGAGVGPWNMGVDEALLATAAAGGPPTLRLYVWDGPWLSLGYAQPLAAARRRACARAGVGVVRRATGGAAVLHGADLTYAVAAPEARLPEGLHATHELVARALVAALRALGVAADRPARPAGGPGFDCFAAAGLDALCLGGRKLAGSAQRRAGGAVLQHGSLRLAGDPPGARRAAGLEAATSLAEIGCDAAPEAVSQALLDALGAALGARLEPGGLAPGEARAAAGRGPEPPGRRPGPRGRTPTGISSTPLPRR